MILRSLEEAAGRFGPCVLTIGNFDGVHAGHRRILRRVVEVARERGWKPSALTFHPHPACIVAPQRVPLLLTTPEQRAATMLQEGIQQVLILPFTREISLLEPEEFAGRVLSQALGVRAVLVGDNFRFGHRHAGDTQLLSRLGDRFGFVVEAIPALRLRGRVVSSSEIRRLVAAGEVSLAGRLLEAPFALQGEVVRGQGVGSKQTVPTLNLAAQTGVLPALGVYVTRTSDLASRRVWPSVSNVGYRPTFGGGALTVETFLLNPLEGATPPSIRVEFLLRLRPERKFPTAGALRAQILRDAARARTYFRRTDRGVTR
ncbi:MAG: riboflavin biosynthesis protein RibF [Bryobacteraceae bacterium]